ncbi:hypothetical protein HDF11_000517 [Tunturiibacter psychrotolerans]
MLSILLVGLDEMLLTTRGLVLKQLANTDTVVQGSPEAALVALGKRNFDLIILCHTLDSIDAKMIVAAAHSFTPKIAVGQVSGAPLSEGNYDDPNADWIIDPLPQELVRAVLNCQHNLSLPRRDQRRTVSLRKTYVVKAPAKYGHLRPHKIDCSLNG